MTDRSVPGIGWIVHFTVQQELLPALGIVSGLLADWTTLPAYRARSLGPGEPSQEIPGTCIELMISGVGTNAALAELRATIHALVAMYPEYHARVVLEQPTEVQHLTMTL